MRYIGLGCISIAVLTACSPFAIAQTKVVPAISETVPVGTAGDAADDPAIWRNTQRPGKSLIIATDKKAGIHVYTLSGKRRSFTPSSRLNNVDLRANVLMRGKKTVLVAASDRSDELNAKMAMFRLDTNRAKLLPIGSIAVGQGEAYGMCMWVRARDKAVFAFVVMKDGRIDQLALDLSGATPTGRVVRSMKLGTQSEGCVADDRNGILYVAEEDVGIWKFEAEPSGSVDAVSIAKVDNVALFADAEGLALAPSGADGGYLVASSQGDNAYTIYSLPDVKFAGRFGIGEGKIDAVSETDGIELALGNFGRKFKGGLFVAQDGDNAPETQNFKMTSWQAVIDALGLK
jgi:myo-inositol-hexaphosphate 3-phosphohydrolase